MQLGQHSCCAAQQSLSRPFYAHVSQSSGKVSLYSVVLVFHPRSRYLVAFRPGCYLYFPSWAVSHVTSVRLQILIRTYITASTAGGRFDVENFWWPGDLFPLGCLFLAHWSLVLSRGVGSYCLMQGPGADDGGGELKATDQQRRDMSSCIDTKRCTLLLEWPLQLISLSIIDRTKQQIKNTNNAPKHKNKKKVPFNKNERK